MTAPDHFRLIEVDTLGLQHAEGFEGVKDQVYKTTDANEVRPLNTQTMAVRQPTLQKADNAPAHNHHDQETGAFAGMFAETGEGQGEDTGPQGGTEQAYADKCKGADHPAGKHAYKQGYDRRRGKDKELAGRITFT